MEQEHKIVELLSVVQTNLKVPKNQYNKFGGYAYRSCEDILSAFNELRNIPELSETVLTVSDELVNIGNRFYVKATARFSNGKEFIESIGYAREPELKKGMDESQITGSASSYARKYALSGLFCLDDEKDADATNTHGESPKNTKQFSSSTQTPAQKAAVTKAVNKEIKQKTLEERYTDCVNYLKTKGWNSDFDKFFNPFVVDLQKANFPKEKIEELLCLYDKKYPRITDELPAITYPQTGTEA